MEKVLIEIIGSQNIDNQFDKTEFKTVGTFEELEEKYERWEYLSERAD